MKKKKGVIKKITKKDIEGMVKTADTITGESFEMIDYISLTDQASITQIFFDVLDNKDPDQKEERDGIRYVEAMQAMQLGIVQCVTNIDINDVDYETLVAKKVITEVESMHSVCVLENRIKEAYAMTHTTFTAVSSMTDKASQLIDSINNNMSEETLNKMTSALDRMSNLSNEDINLGIKDTAMKKA